MRKKMAVAAGIGWGLWLAAASTAGAQSPDIPDYAMARTLNGYEITLQADLDDSERDCEVVRVFEDFSGIARCSDESLLSYDPDTQVWEPYNGPQF
jgi:hypothetical protein